MSDLRALSGGWCGRWGSAQGIAIRPCLFRGVQATARLHWYTDYGDFEFDEEIDPEGIGFYIDGDINKGVSNDLNRSQSRDTLWWGTVGPDYDLTPQERLTGFLAIVKLPPQQMWEHLHFPKFAKFINFIGTTTFREMVEGEAQSDWVPVLLRVDNQYWRLNDHPEIRLIKVLVPGNDTYDKENAVVRALVSPHFLEMIRHTGKVFTLGMRIELQGIHQ